MGRALASVGRGVVRLLHDHAFEVGLKKALPIIVVRLVAYAGGSVETARLIEQGLKAVGW